MGSIISAIATAVPEHRFSQKEILRFMIAAHQLTPANAARLEKLYDVSGIDFRHSVIADFSLSSGEFNFFGNEPGLEPFPGTAKRAEVFENSGRSLALKVTNELFSKGKTCPSDISHVITVSCTGMYAPGLDIDIVEHFHLQKSIERTCINFMGCYGAFNALKTADYICRADDSAKVLIVDIELCTLHFQRESTLENWVANSLFSDGASALIVEAERPYSDGLLINTFFNTLVTEAKDEMAWRIGDTGFQMRLSTQIAKNISKKIMDVTQSLLAKARLSINEISEFAIHPGGRRILEVCEEMLDLPEEALQPSYEVLKEFGNMSSTTILFVLEKLFNSRPEAKIMSFAFGPGLTFESMILTRKNA